MAPLLIIGPTYLDIVSRARTARGQSTQGDIDIALGGIAYRSAYVAAELGLDCRFIPVMRSSPFVDIVQESLEERGVQVTPLVDDSLSLGGYCAHVGEAGNLVVSTSGRVTPAAGLDRRLIERGVTGAAAVVADFGMGPLVLRDLLSVANALKVPVFLTGRSGEDRLAELAPVDPPDAICLTRGSYRRLVRGLPGDGEREAWEIAARFDTTLLVFDSSADTLSMISASDVVHTPLRGLGCNRSRSSFFPPQFLLRLIARMEQTPYLELAIPHVIDNLIAEGDGAVDSAAQLERIEQTVDRMHRDAQTDVLTGALNRRGIENSLRSPVLQGFASRCELALLLLDIDHFKSINDSFGHPAGDKVIRWIVARLRNELRDSDMVGRWGGEEFIGLLPGVAPHEAADVAERIRRHIEQASAADPELPRAITVSIGLAQASPGESWREALIARADAALYQAKRGGRNRVVAATGRVGTGGSTHA